MKAKLFFMEFIVLLGVLYIPPIFVNNISNSLPYISPSSIIQTIIACLLFMQLKQNKSTTCLIFQTVSISTQTFGWLFITSAVIQFSSSFIIHADSSFFYTNYPDSFISWINITFTFLTAAFCEEVFYRLFMPEILLIIIKELKLTSRKKKYLSLTAEVFSICIFALAHKYLGLLSVLNAAICGIILRRCYLCTRNIFAGTISHFIYNFTLIVFSYLLFLHR